jgi:hypothetical protein
MQVLLHFLLVVYVWINQELNNGLRVTSDAAMSPIPSSTMPIIAIGVVAVKKSAVVSNVTRYGIRTTVEMHDLPHG